MRKRLLLSSFACVALSACVTIPATREYTVAGKLDAGMIWADTQGAGDGDLDLDETIDFLEPQPERECVPVPKTTICTRLAPTPERPAVKLPERAGAVCRSTEDAKKLKVALEQACRDLGRRCSYEVKQAIRGMGAVTDGR